MYIRICVAVWREVLVNKSKFPESQEQSKFVQRVSRQDKELYLFTELDAH